MPGNWVGLCPTSGPTNEGRAAGDVFDLLSCFPVSAGSDCGEFALFGEDVGAVAPGGSALLASAASPA